MSLIWSKNDGPERPKGREIPRNCGQLLGRLDELLPFLYVAQYGAPGRALRAQRTVSHPGLFAVGEQTQGDRPGIAPRVGLILPLRLCRNEKTRAALLEIAPLIGSQDPLMLADERRLVQSKLDAAFGGNLTVSDKERLDGFFALEPRRGLFQQLHEEFDYVTAVIDNPAGEVRVTESSRFPWRSHGELLEWYHGLGNGRGNAWAPFVPFFVFGNTAALTRYCTDRWAHAGLTAPAEDPSKWFVIRPDLHDADVGVRLEMGEYGWAYLHLILGATAVKIWLSQVFDPFDELVAWGRKIEEGDIPVQMEIDEEGAEKVLTVLRTDDSNRVLFRVAEKYADDIQLEGIVSRAALAASLKAELRRFFSSEFDPNHWDEEEADEDYVQTRDRVLNHPWMVAA